MYVAPVVQKDRDVAWWATAVFLKMSIPWNRITSYFPLLSEGQSPLFLSLTNEQNISGILGICLCDPKYSQSSISAAA